MTDLAAMATFVEVVRSGHFAAAARALGLPKSTVSQRIARLETALGVRLLERTTRAVRPTSAGVAYFERCTRILADVEEANAEIGDLGASPRGLLRVATPHLYGQSVLAAVAADLTERFPEIEIDVVATDRQVNLIEEGFDVAIAIDESNVDSTMISRRLGGGEHWCCAAPPYLRAHGVPAAPQDLSSGDCILVNPEAAEGAPRGARWTFQRGEEIRRVDVRGRLRLSSMSMVRAAVIAGAGVAVIPAFICAEDVRSGGLVRVLSDWTVDRKGIRAVYPSRRHLSLRVRLFVDALVAATTGNDSAAQPPGFTHQVGSA